MSDKQVREILKQVIAHYKMVLHDVELADELRIAGEKEIYAKVDTQLQKNSKSIDEATQALTTLIKDRERALGGQEHYARYISSGGGTTSQCECGKVFSTTNELNGHINWHLARLQTLSAPQVKEKS